MKTIIAGSRRLDAYKEQLRIWWVADAVTKSGITISEVVSGGARGIDQAGELWAKSMNPPVPIKQFIPDWNKLGKAAGVIRNADMAAYAEALILIWDGTSRGSRNMLINAKEKNLKIYEYIIK